MWPISRVFALVRTGAGDREQADQTSSHEHLIKRMRAAAGVLARGFAELEVTQFDATLDGVYNYLGVLA